MSNNLDGAIRFECSMNAVAVDGMGNAICTAWMLDELCRVAMNNIQSIHQSLDQADAK